MFLFCRALSMPDKVNASCRPPEPFFKKERSKENLIAGGKGLVIQRRNIFRQTFSYQSKMQGRTLFARSFLPS